MDGAGVVTWRDPRLALNAQRAAEKSGHCSVPLW